MDKNKILRGIALFLTTIAATALAACGTSGKVLPAGKNPYIAAYVTDTLTIRLPDYEDCQCYVNIGQGPNRLAAQDIVSNGVVQFSIGSMPAGTYIAWIRVDKATMGVRFHKR